MSAEPMKRKLPKKLKIGAAVATPVLLFTGCIGGFAMGADSDELSAAAEPQPTETVTAEPEPAPTVTETAEPEPAPTVTETPEPEVETVTETPEPEEVEVEVEVEVASQACLDALDAGDLSIDLLSQGLDIASDAMYAASISDVAGIEAANSRIDALTPQLEDAGFDWGFWSEACRSGE